MSTTTTSTTTNQYSSSSVNTMNYIKELEISEGQLSSCLKSVYENNQKEEFMKRLEDRIKQYDVEIEKLCNKNYQSFVDTFNELLSVREDTAQLKEKLIENNQKIQDLGSNLIVKVDELVKETNKQNNILLSIEALNKYLPVFNIYRQFKQKIQAKDYYPALKLLEDLENNYLPIVKQYRFSESMRRSLPLFKEEIKTETITELKDFLESLRVQSEKCGKIATQQMAHKLRIDKRYYLLDSELNTNEPEAVNMKKMPFDEIDFSPLYRNLHMNQVLGSKSLFADYYTSQRKKQLKLTYAPFSTTDWNENTTDESLDAQKRYFHNITGFFVIEDQILSSTEGLVDERYLNDLFNMAVPHLIKAIKKIMNQSKDSEQMLKVKIIIVLFCNTIEEFQFPTIQLSDLLKEIREKYYDMLLKNWDEKIKTILDQDNYTCMEVADEETYNKLIEVFPCKLNLATASSTASTFNLTEYTNAAGGLVRRMPYSACVPKIFVEIKEFVNNCVRFAEGLNSSQTELDDMIRKPTNKLIADKLNENIRQLLSKVSLAQLVQIVVNTIYLEKSIELLEQHLRLVISAASSKQSGKLQGISVFKDLRSEAEAKIYEQLDVKIDELLDFENFNWLLLQSPGIASDYMKSLLSFLKNMLDSFNHLPSKLAQTACISSCKHLAQSITSRMISPEIKAINMGAIEQLGLDLMQCEMFASIVQIEGLDNDTILLCFTDLRQLIDLILSKEWSLYLKDYGQPDNKYNRVQASAALVLLEKLKEGARRGQKKSILSRLGGNSSDNDEVKLMDAIIKQLKALISQNATF